MVCYWLKLEPEEGQGENRTFTVSYVEKAVSQARSTPIEMKNLCHHPLT